MKLLQRLPLRRKLVLIGLVSNGVALIMLSLALGWGEWSDYRARALQTLSVYAGITAGNLAPALLFADDQAAQEVLERLRVEPAIVFAAVRDREGRLLARFAPPDRQLLTIDAPLPQGEAHQFSGKQLLLARPVQHQNEAVGELLLQADLSEDYAAFLGKIGLIVAATLASLGLALFLFMRLQKAISEPVTALAGIMHRVTELNDYSVRAPAGGRDEFGTLNRGFNAMLAVVEEREQALARQQEVLEARVAARTLDLQRLNATLEERVQDALAKNREKDHLLIQQARLAAIGEMMGNIAHQWRQPINALGLLIANIRDAWEFRELDQAYLDQSVRTGQALIQRMSTTIDDFRNFFRPNKEKVDFSVNQAVADSLRIMEDTFKRHNIDVQLSSQGDIRAHGFRNEYSQVVLNLLSNAKDALERKGEGPRLIDIRIEQAEQLARLRVEDNAGGIDPAVLPRIFDPYFTTKPKGTGIGLYMSKMIIEKSMDGQISAHNTPAGAAFLITLAARPEVLRQSPTQEAF